MKECGDDFTVPGGKRRSLAEWVRFSKEQKKKKYVRNDAFPRETEGLSLYSHSRVVSTNDVHSLLARTDLQVGLVLFFSKKAAHDTCTST